MYPWSHTRNARSVAGELAGKEPDTRTPAEQPYKVGDTVYSGKCAGTIVSVDAEKATMGVIWSDGDGGVIRYPIDAPYLERKMPWE